MPGGTPAGCCIGLGHDRGGLGIRRDGRWHGRGQRGASDVLGRRSLGPSAARVAGRPQGLPRGPPVLAVDGCLVGLGAGGHAARVGRLGPRADAAAGVRLAAPRDARAGRAAGGVPRRRGGRRGRPTSRQWETGQTTRCRHSCGVWLRSSHSSWAQEGWEPHRRGPAGQPRPQQRARRRRSEHRSLRRPQLLRRRPWGPTT